MKRVVVLDDDANFADAVKVMIGYAAELRFKEEYTCDCFTNPWDALKYVEENTPDVIISDFDMPIMDGFAFIKEAINLSPDSKFVVMSSADMYSLKYCANNSKVDLEKVKLACKRDPFFEGTIARTVFVREKKDEN